MEEMLKAGKALLLLDALDEKQVREKTDVFVVSDHGFSTVQRGFDILQVLKKAKFTAAKKLEDAEPDSRRIALVRHQRREALSPVAANFVALFRREVERSASLALASECR